MSNIRIYETDITSRTSEYNPTQNVVYIPGFSCGYVKANVGIGDSVTGKYELKDYTYTETTDTVALAGKTYYDAIAESVYNQITFCQTVEDLEKVFGTTPYKFQNEQNDPTKNVTVTGPVYTKVEVVDGETVVTGKYIKQNDSYVEIIEADKKAESGVDYFVKSEGQVEENMPTHNIDIKAGDFDKSYIIAKELLNAGVFVWYDAFKLNGADSVKDLYTQLPKQLSILEDLNTYNVKFITTGAYESLGAINSDSTLVDDSLIKQLLELSCIRNDSVAIIDYKDVGTSAIDITKIKSVVNKINDYPIVTGPNEHIEDSRNYGTIFTPSSVYNVSNLFKGINDTNEIILPGSFAYLISFAKSAQTNANFLAIAGVTRGLVPYLVRPCTVINGKQAEDLTADSGIAINPITYITPYGYCIWGNRTLHNNTYTESGIPKLVAGSFLNIRVLTCDIKKILRNVALKLNFEINSDILWLNFKSRVEKQLDRIIANNGIEKYKLSQIKTDERGKIKVKLTIWCLYAVEKWDMELELTDSYVSVNSIQ